MDEKFLQAGDDYSELKRVYIIMILSYDPFGLDRMVYTVKNSCVEVPGMEYDDGAENIFLYCDGTQGNPPEELSELLHMIRGRRNGEMADKELEDIGKMVDQVKNDKAVTVTFMNMFNREKEERERNIAEGRAEGEAMYAELVERLVNAGRNEELKKIKSDVSLREALYKEFNIR